MKLDIKFHCNAEDVFWDSKSQVKAFVYQEYEIEAHNHQFYEMNIVLKGKGIHQVENASFQVKAGDVFFIPPMVVHAYYETEHLDVYHVLFHRDFIAGNYEEAAEMPGFLQLIEIEPFLRQHLSDAAILHLNQNQLQLLKYDLQILENGRSFDQERFWALRNHTAWKMLFWLSGLLYEQLHAEEQTGIRPYEYAIIQALEYMHQNFREKIAIETLCKQTFLSRSTFLRSFKSICGCSPIQYLNTYRCSKAMEMMDAAVLSKTEIAQNCGFYDLSHMERMLKKRGD